MKKIMKRFFAIVFMSFPIIAFAETGPRIYDEEFSYCPPLNWTVTEFPGLKYKVVIGPTIEDFAMNIVFVDEEYNGNLSNYVSENLYQLYSFFPEYQLLDRSGFRTYSGITGERVIINNRQLGYFLRQIFYFLPLKNNKYVVITCTVVDSIAAEYLSIFEESIKNWDYFNILPQSPSPSLQSLYSDKIQEKKVANSGIRKT